MSYECAHCKTGTMPLVVRHISRARSSHHYFTCYVRRGNYIEALERERDKLRAALRDLIGDPKSGIACNAVHHGPNDHHGALDDCPVVLRYMALLGEEAT